MAEDTKTRQPSDSKTDTNVSDSQLSDAYDAVIGDTPQPEGEKKPEVQPEKQTETETAAAQKERSALGRKVAKMEEQFGKLAETIERMDQFLTNQDQMRYGPQRGQYSDELPQVVSTPEDVERVLSYRDRKFAEARGKYQTNYLKTIEDVREKDDALHQEIYDEMMKNFNVMHAEAGQIGNPFVDAQLNYTQAKATILARKLSTAKPKPNTLGERPSGVTTGTRQKEEGAEIPALDEHAQEFVRRLNIPEADIKRAFSKELPWHLTGGKRR